MCRWLFLLPSFLFGLSPIETGSMLYQAKSIAEKYNLEVAKTAPPNPLPQPSPPLALASIWFSIDLNEIAPPAFGSLASEELWSHLREIGVQAVHLKGLKKGGTFRTGMNLDPKWGKGWDHLACLLQKKGIKLIGDAFGNATGFTPDFTLALQNAGEYPGIYHLIEIEPRDWKRLPEMGSCQKIANIPWLKLQELHKRGYVPEQFDPYRKESRWNVTAPIQGIDGKMRRWIYLKENQNDPVLDWLGSSFGAMRIALADVLHSVYNLDEKIFYIDGSIETNAQETLSLWMRKLGAFSAIETKGGLDHWKKNPGDLFVDNLTPPALLHALVTENTEVLQLMYRLFLKGNIETKRLIHKLQPRNQFLFDYAAFLEENRSECFSTEQRTTKTILQKKLLKEDLFKIQGDAPLTLPSFCMGAFPLEKKWDEVMGVHLLFALFYAAQPGVFSFSVSDLLGLTSNRPASLLEPNEHSLYGSFPSQCKNSCSFASKLKNILSMRINSTIESAELVDVLPTCQKGLLVLLHRQKNQMLQMLAINLSKKPVYQTFDIPEIRHTTPINRITSLLEKKELNSSQFHLELPPLSGKVILFQTKYSD